MVQTYSNPLFLSGQALPATQLNKLSSGAADADTIAANAESALRLPSQHDSKHGSAAPSASRLHSEQDADHLSASASASRLHSEQDADHLSASASASRLHSEQDADSASCGKAASQLQSAQDEASTAEAASRVHSWHADSALDAEASRPQSEQSSVAESVPRPQSGQETKCDAAASSAGTSRKMNFKLTLPRNFTRCDKVMPALCMLIVLPTARGCITAMIVAWAAAAAVCTRSAH